VAWQTPAQRRNIQRRHPYRRFMSIPRAIGLMLMVAAVGAYGIAPGGPALLVGLLGLAALLFADLRLALARAHFSFLVDRAILLTALAVVAAICLFRLFGSEWL
jgi:hypothetical protein